MPNDEAFSFDLNDSPGLQAVGHAPRIMRLTASTRVKGCRLQGYGFAINRLHGRPKGSEIRIRMIQQRCSHLSSLNYTEINRHQESSAPVERFCMGFAPTGTERYFVSGRTWLSGKRRARRPTMPAKCSYRS